jgi:hypothetical protein
MDNWFRWKRTYYREGEEYRPSMYVSGTLENARIQDLSIGETYEIDFNEVESHLPKGVDLFELSKN